MKGDRYLGVLVETMDVGKNEWEQREEKQLRNSVRSLVQLKKEATACPHSSKVSLDGVVEKREEKNEKKQGKEP